MHEPHVIVGHRFEIAALTADIGMGNVAHAYLFAGHRHLGKFTVAKWFAEELLSSGLDDEGKERVHGEVRRLLHPDLFVVDKLWIEGISDDPDVLAHSSNIPQQHRAKAKAKTDSIGIEDIRMLQERLHDVGTGAFRCCLIRSVERMHDEAVNALLKILEEPPPGVVFILTTEALSSLLPTLVSRTRVLRFARVADRDLEPLLAHVDQEEKGFLLRLAQGAPGVIRQLTADPAALKAEKAVFAGASAFWQSRSLADRLHLLAPLTERTEAASQLLLHLSLALREERGAAPAQASTALHALARGLRTNASRPLLVQQFVLALEA